MIGSLAFLTLLAGLMAFVLKFLFPSFPFDANQILAAALFLLGLIGIYPQARAGVYATFGDLLHSLAFWTLVAGVVEFVVHAYKPDFPLDQANILAVIVFVLAQVGIIPELRLKLGKSFKG